MNVVANLPNWARSNAFSRLALTPTRASTSRTRPLLVVLDLKPQGAQSISSKSSSTFSKVRSMSSIATSSNQTAIDAAPLGLKTSKAGGQARLNHINKDPFAPSTKVTPSTHASNTKRDVTHPPLPDLFDPAFLNKLLPPKPAVKKMEPAPDAPKSAFMEALTAEANKQYTQNSAHGFASTGSALVDAFNGLNQATESKDFEPILRKAWDADPLTTLKIIFNLRSIHEGKSDREGFYRAWGWLYRNHPRTAILNTPALVYPLIERKLKVKESKGKQGEADEDDLVLVDAEDDEPEKPKTVRGTSHGYWKDPLNLLILAAAGDFDSATKPLSAIHVERIPRTKPLRQQNRRKGIGAKGNVKDQGNKKDQAVAAASEHSSNAEAAAKAQRSKAHEEFRKKTEQLLETSKPFRALYITVARLFANALESDVKMLKKIADQQIPDQERIDLSFQLSLAGKYAPSLSKAHDRRTNIASAIAELLWERGLFPLPYESSPSSPLPVEKVHNLREAYIRWIVSPIRRFMQIPEIFMSANRWDEIPYNFVSSKCMQLNKSRFNSHDTARFSQYLLDVATGKKTISGGTLLPHSLLMEALESSDKGQLVEKQVIEAQWESMVDKLRESGALDNCLAICDVSGSMGNLPSYAFSKKNVEPIFPAIAISLVVAQVSRPPWANCFITFSESPEIVKVDPTEGLVETANKMGAASWGMNTDFNAVFTKLILPMAVKNKLPKEEMVKRLFVFSDMEFDQSAKLSNGRTDKFGEDQWKTEHEKIAEAFNAAGYDVPEMIYWNLQGASGAKPVLHDWQGVGVMSGFSSNMLKTFMETGDAVDETDEVEMVEVEGEDGVVVKKKEKKQMTPEDVMNKALNRPSFSTLKVED
ncbi:hypothetical protein FRC16_000234 [Serendipita sp. 398]|nr:hypothetical protein FRC16_000234 [Serendipita sp. 398]